MTTIVECQRTLASEVGFTGIGLHTGAPASVCIRPALAGIGIVFSRVDQPHNRLVAARWRNIVSTRHSTTLGNSHGATVATVEHLLAALDGCGVDNAWIDVDGPEIPILDGSARPFVDLIARAGTISQTLPRRYMRIRCRTVVQHGDSLAIVQPNETPVVKAQIDFPSPTIGRQTFTFRPNQMSFSESVASARTFVMIDDVPRLRDNGLALGGSLDNAIVVGSDGVLNQDGLRFPDEFARHKVLDILGDLSLAGARIRASMQMIRPSHTLNQLLLQKLFKYPGLWEYSFEPLRYEAWRAETGVSLRDRGHSTKNRIAN